VTRFRSGAQLAGHGEEERPIQFPHAPRSAPAATACAFRNEATL
jgi:hypothetical protein